MSEFSTFLNLLYRGILLAEGIAGVRLHAAQAIVLRDDGSVLLIRTRYRPNWEFPGGKAERYEAPESAAIRETKEESGVFIKQFERKLGVYTHPYLRRKTTIHVYVAKEWDEMDVWNPSLEISDRKFFPLSELPPNVSRATKNRLAELATVPEREFAGAWE